MNISLDSVFALAYSSAANLNDIEVGDHEGKAFKLTKFAGSYWRGDHTKPQLQRIFQPFLQAELLPGPRRRRDVTIGRLRWIGRSLDFHGQGWAGQTRGFSRHLGDRDSLFPAGRDSGRGQRHRV